MMHTLCITLNNSLFLSLQVTLTHTVKREVRITFNKNIFPKLLFIAKKNEKFSHVI